MVTEFNTQVGNGEYCLQLKTDNKEHYLLAKCCMEGILNQLRQPMKENDYEC